MPRKARRRRHNQDPHINGLIHQLLGRAELRPTLSDYDHISKGRLVAAAEWVPGELKRRSSNGISS